MQVGGDLELSEIGLAGIAERRWSAIWILPGDNSVGISYSEPSLVGFVERVQAPGTSFVWFQKSPASFGDRAVGDFLADLPLQAVATCKERINYSAKD